MPTKLEGRNCWIATPLKPILENDRIVVWDITDSAPARAFDVIQSERPNCRCRTKISEQDTSSPYARSRPEE
jgi:hypothetical protein